MTNLYLKESEERYRLIFENSSEAILLTDTNGTIYSANPESCRIFQRSEKEICSVGREGIVDKNDPRLVLALKERQVTGKFKGELNLVRNDGTIFPGELSSDIFIDNEGHERTIMIIRDISKRKNAEIELQKSEARYRDLFENSIIGISATDINGKLVQANKAYVKMYGYDSFEQILIEVKSIEKQFFANPDDRKEILEILHRKAFVAPKEYELVRRDGSKFYAIVSAKEVRDTDGKLLYNQASHIEVTEQKLIKHELEVAKELLEKLYTALIEVREKERAVISRDIHDLVGQSMTALKMDLSWLLENYIKDSKAVEKVEKMIVLVSEVLTDTQRISYELRPGMLDDLGLSSAIEWYCDEFAKRSGINVEMDIDEVQTESKHKNIAIYRILQESLTNIIRHANACKVLIKLRKIDNYIILTIIDDGIGISNDKIKSPLSLGILGMFERVKQSGGKIEISSPHKYGTKVQIRIPI